MFEPSQGPPRINFLSSIRMKIMKKLCLTTGWCPRWKWCRIATLLNEKNDSPFIYLHFPPSFKIKYFFPLYFIQKIGSILRSLHKTRCTRLWVGYIPLRRIIFSKYSRSTTWECHYDEKSKADTITTNKNYSS